MNSKLILLFSILFIGCKTNVQKIEKKSKSKSYIFKESQINIPISEDEYNLSYLTMVKEYNDTTYVYRKSRYSNDIYIYNWDLKKRIKKISFKNFGPNSIKKFAQAAVYPLNKFDFFISTINNAYITKYDTVKFHSLLMNKTTKSSNKTNSFDNSEMYFAKGQNIYPPIKVNNTIYCALNSSNGSFGTDAFYKGKLIMQYNLNDNEFSKINFSYPYFYYHNCWGTSKNRFSYTNDGKNNLIFLFQIKPILYKFDINQNKIVDSIKIKSNFVKNEIKPINCKAPIDKQRLYSFTTASYTAIKYDKYRNIYYVFVKLPIDIKTYKSVKNPFTLNPFSIIVLDKDFKKLGEQKFKGGIYHTSDFFVTKEGLWLSKNSPHNPEYNENELHFALLNLEKNAN